MSIANILNMTYAERLATAEPFATTASLLAPGDITLAPQRWGAEVGYRRVDAICASPCGQSVVITWADPLNPHRVAETRSYAPWAPMIQIDA